MKKTRFTEEQMVTILREADQRPVPEIRVGRITATIWQNTPTDEGVFYSVHITRLFRRGSTWDRTPAFGRDDLLTVAKVADLANTRIYELQKRNRIPQPAGRRRRRRRRLTHETPRRDRSPPRPSLYMRAPAGGTLEDRLPDGPLAPAQAVSVGTRLADALAALHEKKCLHGARQAQHSPVSPRNRCPSPGRCRSRLPRSPIAPRRAAPRRRPRGATAHVQWRQRRRQQQHER